MWVRKRKNGEWSPSIWGGRESSRFLTSPQKESVCCTTTAVPGLSCTYRVPLTSGSQSVCFPHRLKLSGKGLEEGYSRSLVFPAVLASLLWPAAAHLKGVAFLRGHFGSVLSLLARYHLLRNSSGHVGRLAIHSLAHVPFSIPPPPFFGGDWVMKIVFRVRKYDVS